MTIQYVIEREQMVGTTRKSIWVLLRQGQDWRRCEIPRVWHYASAEAIVSAYPVLTLWNNGTPVEAATAVASDAGKRLIAHDFVFRPTNLNKEIRQLWRTVKSHW